MSGKPEVHNSSPASRKDLDEAWGGTEDVMRDLEEKRVLFQALDSFYQYSKTAHYNTTHIRRQSFYALPQSHWEILAAPPFSYLDTLNAVDDAIDKNAELATAIINSGLRAFGLTDSPGDFKDSEAWKGTATAGDLDKARSTLRQFYRDWSADGAVERTACLGPVIKDLRDERSRREDKSMDVLVPGAGLGRLVFELCRDGFNVEGNEISYHQLLASSYILNHCPGSRVHTIYPWAHGFSNHLKRSQHLQAVQIPDVHPGSILSVDTETSRAGEMSMTAADFISLYENEDQKETFDAVATMFFLDTAPNPIRYIQTIHNCLRKGGIWTNLGPLLWHFENSPPGKHGQHYSSANDARSGGISEPGAVELTDDEIVALVETFGFVMEKRESGIEAGYIQDPTSMMQSTYKVSHWVARKS